MIRKVCSNKAAAVFSIYFIVALSIIAITIIFQKAIMSILILLLILPLILFLVIYGNRLACIVTYDADKNMLYRRGFFGGYRYQLKVEDIEEVVATSIYREGTFYILIDSYNNSYNGLSKKSFIKLPRNKKNFELIKQFWHKPVITDCPRRYEKIQ